MSVKHIKQYYDEVSSQYKEILTDLKDFSELASKNAYSPERLEGIKKNIQPLVTNYETLSYIMFLLNKPNRDRKGKAYEKRNKKFLDSQCGKRKKDDVIRENQEVLDDMKKKNDALSKIKTC